MGAVADMLVSRCMGRVVTAFVAVLEILKHFRKVYPHAYPRDATGGGEETIGSAASILDSGCAWAI